MAAEELEREYRTGDSGAMIREQLKRIKPELEKQFRVQARRSFDRVVLADGSAYSIDETFQGGDDQILRAPQGQQVLRRFLEDKELIYGGTDALDPKLVVQKYIKGAVPVTGEPDVWTAAAVHERLLSAVGLRLIADDELTRRTLTRGVRDGHLVVKLPDGKAYDRDGVVEGPAGARRRVNDGTLNALSLSDDVLVALPAAPAVAAWTAVDKEPSGKAGTKTPPPPPPRAAGDLVTADLAKAVDAAASRPLTQLVLTARTPATARLLSQLAQPFGASSITLSVSVSGDVKGGGTMGLNIEGVKHTHPIKPLDVASAIANSLTSLDGFEASLTLEFEPGLLMAGSHLHALAERSEELRVSARFGPSAAAAE
jgi:hypothetical protein